MSVLGYSISRTVSIITGRALRAKERQRGRAREVSIRVLTRGSIYQCMLVCRRRCIEGCERLLFCRRGIGGSWEEVRE